MIEMKTDDEILGEIEREAVANIPYGYHRVTEGYVQENDIVWSHFNGLSSGGYCPAKASEIDEPVDDYYCIARLR